MLRVGIVGAGQVAARHAAAYAEHVDAQIVAIADTDLARANALASPHAARAHSSYEEMIATEQLDAISVCVPHNLHLPVTRVAAPAGLHMLMEKPIANTVEEATEMLSLTSAGGVRMMICFVHRFRNEVQAARQLITSGEIGAPAAALDKFCSLGGPHPPGWVWSKAQAGGGVLMYGGIHAVDRLLWLLDAEVSSVTAATHQYTEFATEVEDGMTAILTMTNGMTATMFENSPPYGRPGGWETEIFGPEGAVRIHTGQWCELTARTRQLTVTTKDDRQFHRMIAEFVTAIHEDRESSVPGSVGLETLRVASAIYESAETGTTIRL
jgi:predicted dehydrogenase